MRLRAPIPSHRRTWTVELRTRTDGPAFVCPQCGPDSSQPPLPRSAVLAHLAWHARQDALASHLRTCRCQERGCRWHRRHRGCAGPILLVLAREHSGRLWRLADTCAACARATAHCAIVPEPASPALARPACPLPEPRRRRKPGAQSDRAARAGVRNTLSYLAAALPPATSAPARLIALHCTLRADRGGRVILPGPFLRSMRLAAFSAAAAAELQQAGWLVPERDGAAFAGQLLDSTVLHQEVPRAERARASHWALRAVTAPGLRALAVQERLTALVLAAHSPGEGSICRLDADQFLRTCGHMCGPLNSPGPSLDTALQRLFLAGWLADWRWDHGREELLWSFRPGLGLGTATAGERGEDAQGTW